ncbi:hypothetical protein Ac2012v2_002759 [Leucoagaricus gongylophorus]
MITIMKKYSATRNIPSPIDLSVSRSIPGSPDMGGPRPYARYIIELDDATSPVPAPTQEPSSDLSPSSWDSPRRRSCSDSVYSPEALSFLKHSVPGLVNCSVSSPSNETTSASSSHHTHSPCTSPSFHRGTAPKGHPTIENRAHRQRPSTGGKRNKFWSSITQFPLGAGFTVSWDFGHNGDDYTSRKKSRRPGTFPSTPSSWVSSTDQSSCGSPPNWVGSFKKWQQPVTASSATVSSSSPPPPRSSRLEWHWQWPGKRSKTSSPSAPMQTTIVSPPPISFYPSLSPMSASSSTPSTPPSPYIQPTTSKKVVSQASSSKSSIAFQDNNNILTTPPNPNSRNWSTPNLQPPDLSMEDLGKVNALYAPLPSTLAVRVLGDMPHCQVVSGGSESKHPLPSSMPALSTPFLGPIQTSIRPQRTAKGQEIPIALPLSPVENMDDEWDNEEEIGVIYLTVEDVLDEESGEASLRLVEIPK